MPGRHRRPAGRRVAGGITVESAAFADGAAIPERFTCEGDDVYGGPLPPGGSVHLDATVTAAGG